MLQRTFKIAMVRLHPFFGLLIDSQTFTVLRVTTIAQDHVRKIKRQGTSTFVINKDVVAAVHHVESPEVVASALAPSGKRLAVFREVSDQGAPEGKKRFVEIWAAGKLETSLEATSIHGSFYADGKAPPLSWKYHFSDRIPQKSCRCSLFRLLSRLCCTQLKPSPIMLPILTHTKSFVLCLRLGRVMRAREGLDSISYDGIEAISCRSHPSLVSRFLELVPIRSCFLSQYLPQRTASLPLVTITLQISGCWVSSIVQIDQLVSGNSESRPLIPPPKTETMRNQVKFNALPRGSHQHSFPVAVRAFWRIPTGNRRISFGSQTQLEVHMHLVPPFTV